MFFSDTIYIIDNCKSASGGYFLSLTKIENACVQPSIGKTIALNGEKKNYSANIFIERPVLSMKDYVTKERFAKEENIGLTENYSDRFFTLRPGQIITKTDPNLFKNFDNTQTLNDILNNDSLECVYTVIGVSYSSNFLPHFELICR